MRTMPFGAAASLLLLAGVACSDRETSPPPPSLPAARASQPSVVVQVPRLPGSRLLDSTTTADAERWTLDVEVPAESVAAFFRSGLGPAGWTIRSDRADGGAIILLANRVRDEQPLWIRIETLSGVRARYSLIAGFRRPEADSVRPR